MKFSELFKISIKFYRVQKYMSFQQHVCEKIRSPIYVFTAAYTINITFIVIEVLIFPF